MHANWMFRHALPTLGEGQECRNDIFWAVCMCQKDFIYGGLYAGPGAAVQRYRLGLFIGAACICILYPGLINAAHY